MLIVATRHKLSPEEQIDKEFYDEVLLLKYADMTSVRLRYIWLDKVTSADTVLQDASPARQGF